MTDPVVWNLICDWPPDFRRWAREIREWLRQGSTWILMGLLLQIAAGVWVAAAGVDRNVDLPRGFESPVLAYELARNEAEALAVVGTSNRGPLERQFERDTWLILAYTATFAGIGWQWRRRQSRLGWALIGVALAAGTADFIENHHALESLARLHTAGALPALLAMSTAARIKWGLFAPVCVLTAKAVWPAHGAFLYQIFARATASLMMLAGGFYAFGLLGQSFEPYWEFATSSLVPASAGLLLILVLWAGEFRGDSALRHDP